MFKRFLKIRSNNVNIVFELIKMLIVIFIVVGIAAIIVIVTSKQPIQSLLSFFIGPFTTARRFSEIFEAATPLMFTGLGLVVMLRANLFNLAGEGAFFLGALGATIVAVYFPMPGIIHIIACLVTAIVCGAFAALIPAIFKVKWGTSELVTSLMMNYILIYFVIWVIGYVIRDYSAGFVASQEFLPTAIIPTLFSTGKLHAGFIIALIAAAIMSVFIFYTRAGYNVRMTGENLNFAKYSGINTAKVILFVQVLGCAIAGLGGAVEVLGRYDRFRWGASPGYGYTAVAVSMLARKSPKLIPVAAIFYGYLECGAEILGRESDVTPEVIQIIQAVVVILIAAEALFFNWRQRMIVKATANDTQVARSEKL